MKKIQIYDPAMCCSTGVCGPSVDPELLRMSVVVKNLESKKYPVQRFNLTSDTDAFITHSQINTLLNEKGPEVLPIVMVDDVVMMTGQYPSNEELEEWTGFSANELSQKPKVRLSLNVKKGGE